MASRIQSVDRALRILEAMAAEGRPLGLGEVASKVDLHVSTVHRLLATLRARAFVEQDEVTGRYRVGTAALRVGSSFLSELDLRPSLRPVLEGLAARSKETANLVILQGLEAVYVDHVIGTKVAKLFTQVGQRVPLHCTAVGKVLMAFSSQLQRDALPSKIQLTRFTKYTLTTRRALMDEIAKVRATGYALDREEHEIGVACVAAPIVDGSNQLTAAIGVSGPSGRILGSVNSLARIVQAAAFEASRSLGHASSHKEPPGRTGTYRPATSRRLKTRTFVHE